MQSRRLVRLHRAVPALIVVTLLLAAAPARAQQDSLCDPSFEDCRARVLDLIRNETVGIDVAFWFMEDARYTAELIRRWEAGVPVRVIIDPQANARYPLNADRIAELQAAGIPMRKRNTNGILHFKLMLFEGQDTIEFSAANYSPFGFTPIEPYRNYTDEVIYFTSDQSIVNSFRTKYDDLWVDTVKYANYANITGPLTRRYAIFPKDPELNFPPEEPYRSRAVQLYDAETEGMDVIMFRTGDPGHADAMIRAVQRGVPVRLYTEQDQYRDPERYLHSYDIDRMFMAGVQVKDRAHAGSNHQKSIVLKGQQKVIWGSSNWTPQSNDGQQEHNYFTAKPYFYDYFVANFERKWNNSTGNPETKPFVPLPPDPPQYLAPADQATDVALFPPLRWLGGLWAHKYDIYFGTSPNPPLLQADVQLGPSVNSSDVKLFGLPRLEPSTTYYWRIVSKTMANRTAAGPIRSFTTRSGPPAPPGDGTVVLFAWKAPVIRGNYTVVPDSTAAGGFRIGQPNAGAPKVDTASANPADYYELTFQAEAGVPYRLWLRGKADADHWANDSIHVQFSGTVSAGGAPRWRIGTTSSTVVTLEEDTHQGVAGWGWQDNGAGMDVFGEDVIFETQGTQTIRLQLREDGFWIDQIVLSPWTYRSTRPGALKNDTTILPESETTEPPPPPPPPPPPEGHEIVLWAGKATTFAGRWAPVADTSAAGGRAMVNVDAGAPKVLTALAAPADYFEMTFNALAGIPYRLWIRGRAQNDYWGNDSVHVQFSGSVSSSGGATYRIGTTASTEINLEDGSGAGLAGWGWQDNGYGVGVLGPLIYFATTGPQTIRIQAREDGLRIDQIVLSATTYVSTGPGTLKNDTKILAETTGDTPPPPPPPGDSTEIVLWAGTATAHAGRWIPQADTSAAGGQAMVNADNGTPKILTAGVAPADYFEMTFNANAGTAYRLWIRGRAQNDYWGNDSVHVQFSGSVTASGTPTYRIGTTASTEINLEDGSGAGLAGWGWQDNGYGVGVLGPVIYFAATGTQTIRIQTREDGFRIDQIVLSSATYVTAAPGSLKNDATILPQR